MERALYVGRVVRRIAASTAPPLGACRSHHTLGRQLWVAALLLILQPTIAQPQPAIAAPGGVEYALLTPGIAGQYGVAAPDLTLLVGSPVNSSRALGLREKVAKEGYNASASLALAMKEELQAAGFRTEVEPVPRAKPGQPQRLARADLPANPNGLFLLDVVIESIGLASFKGDWEPAIQLSWRVLRPSGEIVVPTHSFFHGPYIDKDGNKHSRTSCGLPNFTEALQRSQDLWDCFDRGLRDASRALIPMIREKQDVALHGKSVSPGAGGSQGKPTEKRKTACRPRDVLDGKCESG